VGWVGLVKCGRPACLWEGVKPERQMLGNGHAVAVRGGS
jgi:hypothetical protein